MTCSTRRRSFCLVAGTVWTACEAMLRSFSAWVCIFRESAGQLWNPTHDPRAQPVRQPQRQAAPDLSGDFKFGIGRRKVWSGLASDQKYLVVQVRDLGIPLLLEGVCPGAFLAAAEIKGIHAGLRGKLNELPPQKIVGCQRARQRQTANIVRMHGVSKEE